MADEDFGLLIVNDGGETQIDGTYKNLMEYEVGSTQLDMYFNLNLGTCDFVDFDDANIAFPVFKVIDVAVQVKGLVAAAGDYTGFTVEYENTADLTGPGLVFKTLNWHVYRDVNKNTIPEFGLMVKNQSDEVVFTSDEKPFNIVGIYSGDFAIGDADEDVTVIDATNNYFTIFPADSWSQVAFTQRDRFFRGIKKKDASTVTVTEWQGGGSIGADTCPPLDNSQGAWVDGYVILEIDPVY